MITLGSLLINLVLKLVHRQLNVHLVHNFIYHMLQLINIVNCALYCVDLLL